MTQQQINSIISAYLCNPLIMTTVDVVNGTTVNLDMSNFTERYFIPNGVVSSNKTVLINNFSSAIRWTWRFQITTLYTLTFESNVKMADFVGEWNPSLHKWTIDRSGTYEATASYDGTNWLLKIIGAF